MTDTAISTKHHKGSAAEVCRQRGWKPGTRLIGDEGYGPTVIEITTLGERAMLARCLSSCGYAVAPCENEWVLWCRDWRVAANGDIPAPFLPGDLVERNGVRGTVVSGPNEMAGYIIDATDGKRWLIYKPKRVRTGGSNGTS